mmetsp:Transcript_64679/g.182350  ORF Transcript_64679/g.182350 Transcript_64679/m.182350 type:complete len:326 (-) Transcript_64679:122-1099(-)
MGLQDLRVLPAFCGCCCCFWLIFTVIALPMSFKSLDQGKYALELNWSNQKIGETVQIEPGMKFLGLGNVLLEYPSVFQTMYFANNINRGCDGDQNTADCHEVIRPPIYARSADGLEMLVSVSMQWRLQPQALIPLYSILGNDLYKDEFVRFARAAVVEACSKYKADDYFTNRTIIKAEMIERLSDNFNQPARGLEVEINDVQLREVDLPDAFDDEIANTQEQMQEVEVAEAEREEQRIAMEREIMVATEKVTQLITEAAGEAEKVRLNNEAFVNQMLLFQRKQAVSNAEILQNFENDADPFGRLFDIMKIKAIRDHSDTKLLINM